MSKQQELHDAVRTFDMERIQVLLAEPIDLETRDHCGWTPLLFASVTCNSAIVKMLICAGADVDARCPITKIFRYNDLDTPLFMATLFNRTENVLALLEGGANVDLVNRNGWTVLMTAVNVTKRHSIIELLLNAGADTEIRNNVGQTASDITNEPEVQLYFDTHRHLVTAVRPEIVAVTGGSLPTELAELCGDYAVMTPQRRAFHTRQIKQH